MISKITNIEYENLKKFFVKNVHVLVEVTASCLINSQFKTKKISPHRRGGRREWQNPLFSLCSSAANVFELRIAALVFESDPHVASVLF